MLSRERGGMDPTRRTNLVVEEITRKSEGESEEREQTLSEGQNLLADATKESTGQIEVSTELNASSGRGLTNRSGLQSGNRLVSLRRAPHPATCSLRAFLQRRGQG